eukprot:CAMPEP_0113663186 /NCGR_PEP_ID=MMETSP0038_2-20120614/996_1 /TAXON_ID=2898 /ORGANISM="Cryptomonas paramecium" /LENGTH=222 /DNA_ID=CAMNT_0000578173 /DNA_START=231 /DNA_END=896 /DNA_ORIENTATION=+ /assembly_acc=CAM_ASM_000170
MHSNSLYECNGDNLSDDIMAVTWNIAAVNNNPFEYWVTHNDPAYNVLMADVQSVMDSPGEHDDELGSVMTDIMMDELCHDMAEAGIFSSISDSHHRLDQYWRRDLRPRKAISGFLADRSIGAKRLASMPDRITNTIRTADGPVLFRPAAVNCFHGDLSDYTSWWRQWRHFVFHTTVRVHGSSAAHPRPVCALLEPISRAKYPAVTEEEETISVPLQILCLAV